MFSDTLEGSGGGESASIWGSGPGPADQLVGLDLVVCAGVGSCGSVQTTGPSATYHTSLCRLRSFSGLSARRKTLKEKQQVWTENQRNEMLRELRLLLVFSLIGNTCTSQLYFAEILVLMPNYLPKNCVSL